VSRPAHLSGTGPFGRLFVHKSWPRGTLEPVRRVGGQFLLAWTAAGTVGVVLGALAGTAGAAALGLVVEARTAATAGWVTGSLVLGVAQWLVCRGVLPRTEGHIDAWWLTAYPLGALAAHLLSSRLTNWVFGSIPNSLQWGIGQVDGLVLIAALAGLIAGSIQWRVLRRVSGPDEAGWWVPGLTVGLAVGQAVEFIVEYRLLPLLAPTSLAPVRNGLTLAGGWIIGGPVLGVVSGVVLVRVLRLLAEEDVAGVRSGRESTRNGVAHASQDGYMEDGAGQTSDVIEWPVWTWWAAVTLVASGIGYAAQFVSAGLAALLTPVIGGFGQWLVLRGFLPHASRWWLATVLGALVGQVVGTGLRIGIYLFSGRSQLIELAPGEFLHAATVAALVGGAQWLVMRSFVRDAWWWVLATTFAATITGAARVTVEFGLNVVFSGATVPASVSPVRILLSSLILGGIEALISATAIVWLLRRRVPPPASSTVVANLPAVQSA
jgi:hypothetical protein